MRLIRAQVQNFRSVENSTPFEISDVTCLVGKNESGKTSVLQAIERLNPVDATRKKYDKLKDYPRRHWSDYAERHPDGDARVLSTTWSLSDDDIAAVEKLVGKGALKKREIEVAKQYETEHSFWTLNLDQAKVTSNLAAQAGIPSSFTTVADLLSYLVGIENPGPAAQNTRAKIDAFRDKNCDLAVIDVLSPRMPKFLYFSEYSRMHGDISVEKLATDRQQNRVSEGDDLFLKFLEYAGTKLEDLRDSRKFDELRAKLEAASNKITERVFEYLMSDDAAPIRSAPIAFWRVAQAFLSTLYALFGGPEDVARRHTITAPAHALLASWLRCAEAMLRRLVLIEAAHLKPAPARAARARRPRTRQLMHFDADHPEAWRVTFRVSTAADRRLPAGTLAHHQAEACASGTTECRLEAGGPRLRHLRSAWPLAERYEALIRVFNDPTAYAPSRA